jgi:hypothetical protein
LAGAGLCGCTALISVSEKGAWLAHFFESPPFLASKESGDFTEFQKQIVDAIDVGVPGSQKKQYIDQYALGELRNKEDKEALGHMFDDASNPQLFLIIPRARRILVTQGGNVVGWSNDPNAGTGTEGYPEHNEMIIDKLNDMFGDDIIGRARQLPYSPMTQNGWDDGFDTARGKVLIQYMPAPKPCPDADEDPFTPPPPPPQAKWRLYFENGGELFKITSLPYGHRIPY